MPFGITAGQYDLHRWYYPMQEYFLAVALGLSCTDTKNVGYHPTSLNLGSGKTLHTDYETTSPRISVNRRTPSCMLLNFPDSDSQDRSATLQFPLSDCKNALRHKAV